MGIGIEKARKYITHKAMANIINKTCINKRSFSKEEADDIITVMASEKKLMYYYKCDFCGSYHLSRKSSAVSKIEVK